MPLQEGQEHCVMDQMHNLVVPLVLLLGLWKLQLQQRMNALLYTRGGAIAIVQAQVVPVCCCPRHAVQPVAQSIAESQQLIIVCLAPLGVALVDGQQPADPAVQTRVRSEVVCAWAALCVDVGQGSDCIVYPRI